MKTPSLRGRRILLVEDDYLIALDVATQLEDAGATVAGPAPSVATALGLLDREAGVDAAVLDVNLGQENSFPVARVLQERGIPFLFSTGYNPTDIPAEWRHVIVSTKPLRLGAVEELLAHDEPLQG